jgi:hypothetical protein
LSYVWGKKQEEIVFSSKLPQKLPLTIKESIIATQWLGYQYLWVDHCCIDQGNQIENAQQVGKMDLIYQMSEVTITRVQEMTLHMDCQASAVVQDTSDKFAKKLANISWSPHCATHDMRSKGPHG